MTYTHRRAIVALVSVSVVLLSAFVYTSATNSIKGKVLQQGSNEPLPDVEITLEPAISAAESASSNDRLREPTPSAVSNREGIFTLANVPAGRYRLVAKRNGYATREFGSGAAGQFGARTGIVLNVAADRNMTDLTITMTRGASVAGRIAGGTGEALSGLEVLLLRSRYNEFGVKGLVNDTTVTTDDRGEFRLHGIDSGQYYLVVRQPQSLLPRQILTIVQREGRGGAPPSAAGRYPITWYPGVTDFSRAVPIEIQSGADVQNVNFTVPRSNSYSVSGRVIDEAGQPVLDVGFLTLPRPIFPAQSPRVTFMRFPDGVFDIDDLTPGSYWISVTRSTKTNEPLYLPGMLDRLTTFAAVDVQYSDVENVVIKFRHPVPLAGSLTMEGVAPSADASLQGVVVALLPQRDTNWPQLAGMTRSVHSASASDGTFRYENVLPDTYRVVVTGLQGQQYVKDARYGEVDLLQNSMILSGFNGDTLRIVLSPHGGDIQGTLRDENNELAGNREVVLIPEEPLRKRADLYRTSISDDKGNFGFNGVAPGSYRLFSWKAIEPYAYFEEELIRSVESRGVPVRILAASQLKVEVKALPTFP